MARSQALREARNGLLDALQTYHRVALSGRSGGSELAGATHRLATLCATLGLEREARALKSLVPEP
jgi:hypothetical protein